MPAGLSDWLRVCGVRTLFVCGVATEYCVRATVLDSLAEGFATMLLTDAGVAHARWHAWQCVLRLLHVRCAALP
jgi:nicotinamidase/pyrazinamidase